MRRARVLLRGVWEFVVGDDWRTAAGVVLALGVVAALAAAGLGAWWVLPPAVLALLANSVRRELRTAHQTSTLVGSRPASPSSSRTSSSS